MVVVCVPRTVAARFGRLADGAHATLLGQNLIHQMSINDAVSLAVFEEPAVAVAFMSSLKFFIAVFRVVLATGVGIIGSPDSAILPTFTRPTGSALALQLLCHAP